jgi:hypothetical protein
MKISLKKAGILAALLFGAASWQSAQAADVSHPVKPFNDVGGNVFSGSTFKKATLTGSTFTDTFTFNLTDAYTTFSDFQVSSIQANPLSNPLTTGLSLTGFKLTGPGGGTVYTALTASQSGVVDLWEMPTLLLTHGLYTISVVGVVNSGASFSVTGTLTQAVPEPETYGMMLAGLGLLGVVASRKRRRDSGV